MADTPPKPKKRTPDAAPPAGKAAPEPRTAESSGTGGVGSGPALSELEAAQPAGQPDVKSDPAQVGTASGTSEAAAAAVGAAVTEECASAEASRPAGSMAMELPDLGGGRLSGSEAESISLLNDVKLDVKIELGRANMRIEEVLQLGEGSVVELDKLAGDPVDVLVNERLVARGEVLVLNDNFCVRISEVLAGDETEGGAR